MDEQEDSEKGPLDDLAEVLKDERKNDIEARESAGFDKLWRRCEDNYAGVDEMNMAEALIRPRYTKPMDLNGPLIEETLAKATKNRATAYLRLTARYVDAGKAKLAEILLPANDKSYSIKPTPIPSLVMAKENIEPMTFPADHPLAGQPMLRDPKPEELAPPNPADPLMPPTTDPNQPPSQMPGVPLTAKDAATEKEEIAEKKTNKAEQQIDDWFIEGKYRKKMRRVLFSMAKLGVGVVKAPVSEMRKSTAVKRNPDNSILIERLQEVKPSFEVVSPWDFYPDKDCGDDIHSGSHVWQRARVSERKLKSLKALPGYIPPAIDRVVTQGPGNIKDGKPKDQIKKDDRYELWHRTGTINKEQADAFNKVMNTKVTRKGKDKDEEIDLSLPLDQDDLMVTVTMVNDTLIRCVKHTLETGDFNYHAIPWQERDDSWVGIGVAEQGFMPQDLVVATIRSMINNAGNSSGPQIVINRSIISAADGDDSITPWKLWEMAEAAAVDDIRKAFGIFPIPSEVKTLMQLAEFALRLFEESTSIPLVTQGQSGDTTPETLGGMQLQNNNANQLLRDVANHVDDYGTEPIVTQFHEHLLLDPDVDEECKGDHQIDAHGSIVLVERYIQNQFIASLGAVVKDPAFGINPKKWIKELMKANHYDPNRIQYTDLEQQKLASVPPPKDPKIQVAEIQAQVDLQEAKMEQDRDTQFVQAESQRTQIEYDSRIRELMMKRELAILDYSNKNNMLIEKVKADLAATVMELKTQKELATSQQIHEAKQVAKSTMEPAGKAPDGEAFQK